MPNMRARSAAGSVARTSVGASLSRSPIPVAVAVTSTQLLSSPVPENEDFCQLVSEGTGFAFHMSWAMRWMKSRDLVADRAALSIFLKRARYFCSWGVVSMNMLP